MISVILRLGCVLVLVLTPAASDSFFDSAPEAAFYISNITEWRKDIPTPLVSGQDFPFSEFQDMHSSEPFELKDTASECSMDSAYQSQTSASRRGMKRPQPYSRDSQNTHPGSDIYSPSMRSETYSYQDMNQLHLPTPAGAWETTEYANYSTAQDFSLYPTSTQFTPASGNLPMQWGGADSQYQSAFNFPSYPMGQQAMFGSVAPSPQPWGSAHMSTERPSPARNSSFTALQNSHQTSNDAAFAALVASPVSTASAQLPVVEFNQQYQDQGAENEDSTSTSAAAQSLNGQEDLHSPVDTAEARLEEERTKVARSDVLYQRGPSKDGKYHCPEEGKPGCTHQPTSLKCNYDKFVDSHLKPFRCNKKSCTGVRFSSTACLLRHEREAHGMHGHGARPHLCMYKDCERAAHGNGFPRRYNLFDHMRRVHQFDGPTDAAPGMPGQPKNKPLSRKRRAEAEESNEKRQKVAKISAEQLLQQRRDQLALEFLNKKQHIINFLAGLTSPSDLRDDRLNQEVTLLHGICENFRSSHGG